MAEPGVIEAYLTELRFSVARLPNADDILAEAEDHLRTSVELAVGRGVPVREAEARALGQFGSASLVARVFNEEAKRGGAVSTTITRRAGVAAMLVPLLVAVGETGNQTIERGALHGLALGLLVAGFAAFTFALWGLRRRHGGLGRWGRGALWLFVASPFIAAPFGWGAGIAFLCVHLLVLSLVGVGMLHARVLPPVPVGLFTLTPVVTLVAAAGISVGAGDTGPLLLPAGILVSSIGLAWLGLVLWREPALDMRPAAGTGPFATA